MNEKELVMFKDLSFKITNETKELLLDMLYIKQMLNESELSLKDRKILEKEYKKIFKQFRKEFQAHNPIETQIMRSYFNSKKQDSE